MRKERKQNEALEPLLPVSLASSSSSRQQHRPNAISTPFSGATAAAASAGTTSEAAPSRLPSATQPPRDYFRSPKRRRERTEEAKMDDGPSPKRLREKYLRQLGYTPLIFQVLRYSYVFSVR